MERELDRQHVGLSLFNTLDIDGSGFIDFGELSTLSARLTPSQNLKETEQLMHALDKNDDGKISKEEFVSYLQEIGKDLSDEEFVHGVMSHFTPDDSAREELLQLINEKDDTSQSTKNLQLSLKMLDNRMFLEKKILPSLKPALKRLLVRLQDEHIKLASGVDWDSSGYRPRSWRPFNPLAFLATALRDELTKLSSESSTNKSKDLKYEENYHIINSKHHSKFITMDRQDQCTELFNMITDDDGVLVDIFSAIDALAEKNDPHKTHKVFQIIDSISPMKPGHLTESEFFAVVDRFIGDVSDEEFGSKSYEIYERIRFSSMSREDKIKLVFSIVDKDESQSLDLDEIFALGQILNPNSNNIRQAKLTMMWFHNHSNGNGDIGGGGVPGDEATNDNQGMMGVTSINEEEFVKSMSSMTADMTNEQFNSGIQKIISAFKDDSPIDGTLTMTSELQAYVKSLPTYTTARQKSVMFVRSLLDDDADHNLLFIDVRSEPESAVSSLPCAIQMDVDEHGDIEENVKVTPEILREAVGREFLMRLSLHVDYDHDNITYLACPCYLHFCVPLYSIWST